MSTQPYAFISYASADRERVLPIVASLREAGIICWLDQHDIVGGANWGGSIADAIEGCSAFVLMSSAASLASRNVRQEIALAWQHDKPYVPLLLDATPIPNDVAYWLATAQWINVLDYAVEVWLPKVAHALSGTRDQQQDADIPAADDVAVRLLTSTYLPSPPSSFIGREREVAEIAALLHTERIVTLVGPGGIGKTRVAIAVGHRLTNEYADGIVFVDLAPLRDPALVLPTIAAALGVRESGQIPLAESLAAALQSRHLFVILDNFEQVIDAARDISRLVSSCPLLAVLTTSREPLRIGGEVEYPIASLTVPQIDRITEIERLRVNPTVVLFIDRTGASQPQFELTTENAEAVAAICRRVEGVPLAVELAAARLRILTPAEVLARLDTPLQFLTTGTRDAPQRQRTIRDTIAWSYDLLATEEQRLLRRLAVFVGGWTFDAAAVVVNADAALGIDVLDGLESLVDKSLVVEQRQSSGANRFRLLETIREFGLERLHDANESQSVQNAYIAHFTSLAEQVEPMLLTPQRETWLLRLDAERDNLRSALHGCLDGRDIETGLRLAGALGWYWYLRGHLREGQEWFSDLGVATNASAPTPVRAKALTAAARLAFYGTGGVLNISQAILADAGVQAWRSLDAPWDLAHALIVHAIAHQPLGDGDLSDLRESLSLFRAFGDEWGEGQALLYLGALSILGRSQLPVARSETRACLTEATRIFRQIGDDWPLSATLLYRALVAEEDGDLNEALTLLDEGVSLMRASHDRWRLKVGLIHHSSLAYRLGDDERALRGFQEVMSLAEELGQRDEVANTFVWMGRVLLRKGVLESADEMFRRSGVVASDLGLTDCIGIVMQHHGDVALARGEPRAALTRYREALELLRRIDPPTLRMQEAQPIVGCMSGCAAALWQLADYVSAGMLLRSVDHFWRATDAPGLAIERMRYDAVLEQVRSYLVDDRLSPTAPDDTELAQSEAVEFALRVTHG